MKTRSQIYNEAINEMPDEPTYVINQVVAQRLTQQADIKESYNDDSMKETMHYPDAYGSGSIFDY